MSDIVLEDVSTPNPMFLFIDVVPFTKWGIDFTTCNPTSTRGNHYIIVVVYYFTKWVESMPTFSNDGKMMTLFVFNQIISMFGILKEIVTNHEIHFQNKTMTDLTSIWGSNKNIRHPIIHK
jgi:hypothetical protein